MKPRIEELEEHIVDRSFTITQFQQWKKVRYKQDSPNLFGLKFDFIHYYSLKQDYEFQLGFQYGKPWPLFMARLIKPDLWNSFKQQLSKLNWSSTMRCAVYDMDEAVWYHRACVNAKPNADLISLEKALSIIAEFAAIPDEVVSDIMSEMKIAISCQTKHLKNSTLLLQQGNETVFKKINTFLRMCKCHACESASVIINNFKSGKGNQEIYRVYHLFSDPEPLSLFQNEVNIIRVIHSKKKCESLESHLVFDWIRELCYKKELRGIIAWCDAVPEEDVRYDEINYIAYLTLCKLRNTDISNKITIEEALFKRAWLIAEYKRFNSDDLNSAFVSLSNLFGETNNSSSGKPEELLIQYARKMRRLVAENNELKIQLATANIYPSKLNDPVLTNNLETLTKCDEDNFAMLNALVESRAERMIRVKHGIFKGQPPRNVRELNETLDSIKQGKLDSTSGLERLNVIACKMGENDPIAKQIQQCMQLNFKLNALR